MGVCLSCLSVSGVNLKIKRISLDHNVNFVGFRLNIHFATVCICVRLIKIGGGYYQYS